MPPEWNLPPALLSSVCRGSTVGFGVVAMPVIVVLMDRIIALVARENKDLRLTIHYLGPSTFAV
jgi:hypothetical protein